MTCLSIIPFSSILPDQTNKGRPQGRPLLVLLLFPVQNRLQSLYQLIDQVVTVGLALLTPLFGSAEQGGTVGGPVFF